jgi:hypothetical protein
LVVKRNKCVFGTEFVAYLGHVISAEGVAMDTEKVATVKAWPPPRAVHAVRGFLSLTGYYRKFICSYNDIVAPLTQLLKREAFCWTPEAAAAFDSLKAALTSAPVLQLPDFTKSFIVDCDALGSGMGAVLHQDQGLVAFFSRAMAQHYAKLAAYERELIGHQGCSPLAPLLMAVQVHRPHRPLQFEIPSGSATVYNSTAPLGQQTIRVPICCGIQAGPAQCRRRCAVVMH